MGIAEQYEGRDLLDRYRSNFNIPEEAPLTEEMVMRHWELERALTRRLLESTPENRWEVFEECYTRLYSECDWLNRWQNTGSPRRSPDYLYGDWAAMLGAPPQRVYEVGSGKGNLVRYLSARGYECRGSEVTKERGQRFAPDHPNLQWGVSDGVHLGRFEPAEHYDAVVSDQVIEHLHPDDLLAHLEGVFGILRPGGRYLFSTPHRLFGPLDVSRVFGSDVPLGMHLKEYTHREIVRALREAGFADVRAPVRVPRKIRAKLGGRPRPWSSRAYLTYLILLERLIDILPNQRARRRAARAARFLLFDGVWIVAVKP